MRPFTDRWRQRRVSTHRGRHVVRAIDAASTSTLGTELHAISAPQYNR
jgi:hypothetical protein